VAAVEDEMKLQFDSTGQITVTVHALQNIRDAVIPKERLPTIQEYGQLPEKALKGSAIPGRS
jgi:hypothetical protein